MQRLTRASTRYTHISTESNSPIIRFSSLYTKTHFSKSIPINKLLKSKNLKPLTSAFPNLKQNYSSLRHSTPVMDSTTASAATDDFVHVEDDAVKSDSIHSDEAESVIDEAVNSSNSDVNNHHQTNENYDNDENINQNAASEIGGNSYERKVLPEELANRVMMLTCESTAEGGVCDVYIVGTAHVSTESCEEVKAVISFLKPQVVYLELCSSRVAILTPTTLKVPTMKEMIQMYKKKQNLFGILYSWFLTKVASKLEVLPGAEFRVGFDEAMKYGGKVILGDRPVQITLRRTWGKMPLWHKTKLMFTFLFQAFSLPDTEALNKMLKEMDDVDMITLLIQEMSKTYPTLMETLVHERDKYMSSTLLRVAKEHNSVVAVVGKGHLSGIKKYWEQPIELKELLEDLPVKKAGIPIAKIVKSLGVAATGVAIISGIYLSYKK